MTFTTSANMRQTAALRSSGFFRATFYIYIFITCIFTPLVAPLRVFEVWNSAYIVYANLAVVLLFALSARSLAVFVPDRYFLGLLIACLVLGTLNGLPNLESGDLLAERNYLSHVFQLLAAYVMFSIGRSQRGEIWSESVMRALMLLTLASDFTGTAIVYSFGVQYGLGGYLVGTGASFAALCFFLPRNRGLALAALLILVLSGKRGPLVAGLVVFGISMALPAFKRRLVGISPSTLIAIAFGVTSAAFISVVARPDTVDQVFASLEERIMSIPVALLGSEESERRSAAGGRYDEVEYITQDFSTTDWILGRGFGFQISIIGEEEIVQLHNVHFTPATLATRFGLPLAVLILAYMIIVVINGFLDRIKGVGYDQNQIQAQQRETGLLYLMGSSLILLTAFTIFADLFIMFYLGWISTPETVSHRSPKPTNSTAPRLTGPTQAELGKP
jgi:hypothetical protein